MGLFLSKLVDAFNNFQGQSARILMLGLDAAGKTTILYKVKLNEHVHTIPTIGFNVETVEPVKGVTFTVWDIGGQDRIRPLWRQYFNNTEGLLFIVDSQDRSRLDEVREELFNIVHDDQMRDVPVVVMANKQDLPGAMKASELIDSLKLRELTNKWYVQSTCAVSGEGVYEAIEEMARLVKEYKKIKRTSTF